MTGIVRRARNHLIRAVRGVHFLKGKCELEYWRGRVRQEVTLHNDHYAWFYTTHFGFEDEFYRNKRGATKRLEGGAAVFLAAPGARTTILNRSPVVCVRWVSSAWDWG